MMAARAATVQNPWDAAVRRVLRAALFLLIVALHAALLLLATRWQARLDLRSEESLIFLPLPGRVREPSETPPAPQTPHTRPPPTRATQLIIVPKDVPPAPTIETPPAAIDWNAEAALTAKQQAQAAARPAPRALDQQGAGLDFDGGLEPESDAKPEFGWYHARTHRIEALECGIGKIPARADLFNRMHDAPAPDHPNTAP
jgi:hypothetical protein